MKPISMTRPEASAPKATEVMSLKAICAELKLDPRLAREKLRIAVREAKKFPELAKAHKPRSAWEWPKGSEAEQQARAALAG
eukprot:gene44387-biopygen35773